TNALNPLRWLRGQRPYRHHALTNAEGQHRIKRSATAHAARRSSCWTSKAPACAWIVVSTSRNPGASRFDPPSRRRLLQTVTPLLCGCGLATVVRWRLCPSLVTPSLVVSPHGSST